VEQDGNDMDTYADDLYALFEKLDIKNVMVVGHSTGGGEVVRLIARHGSSGRISKAVLVSAIPPLLMKTDRSPEGVPLATFNSFRDAMSKDRAQFFIDVPSGPFFGFNRENAKVSQGAIWNWYRQGMACSFKSAYECITVFSETDFIEDLKGIEIPVLVLHGDDDQIVPIGCSARKTIKLLKNGTLKEFPGSPHALPVINVQEVNEELLKFLKS
jgi:non-heme chloroperoxidase